MWAAAHQPTWPPRASSPDSPSTLPSFACRNHFTMRSPAGTGVPQHGDGDAELAASAGGCTSGLSRAVAETRSHRRRNRWAGSKLGYFHSDLLKSTMFITPLVVVANPCFLGVAALCVERAGEAERLDAGGFHQQQTLTGSPQVDSVTLHSPDPA